MLRVLDLFSGIGGFSLGLERTGGFETAAFCEFAEFPRKLLAKHWPNVPIFEDVRTLKGTDIDGPIDVVCGGYPCQPFSTAGRRKGQKDDRYLWPEFSRLVAELRPSWVIGENVAGHISMGLDDVLSDLEGQGYAARTFVIPACATGAPHRRDRTWIVAYTEGERCGKAREPRRGSSIGSASPSSTQVDVAHADSKRGPSMRGKRENFASESAGGRDDRNRSANDVEWKVANGSAGQNSRNVADAIGGRRQGSRQPFNASYQEAGAEGQAAQPVNGGVRGKRSAQSAMGRMVDGISSRLDGHCRWLDEPDIPRVAKGVKNRANRLKALGNAVVPQIAEMIGHAILEAEKENA